MPPRRRGDDESDEDDDELAALRSARSGGAAKPSISGPPEDEDPFLPSAPRSQKGPQRPPPGYQAPSQSEGAGQFEVQDDVRSMLPMSFGVAKSDSSKQVATGKKLQEVHDANKRADVKPSGRSDLDDMVREMQMKAGGGPAEAAEPSGGEGGPGGGREGREGEGEKMEEGSEDDDDDDDDDDSDEDDDDNGMGKLVPCSHEALLKGHTKAVTTVALDPSGSRLLTGSADSTVKFWDFNGMTAALKNFREITPWEGQSVTSLAYSNTGDKFLCATTKNQCTLYTRDGIKEVEFGKGDMYVHDMAQTKGHVAALVSTRWDPKDKGKCLTAAIDGTVRLWDLETCNKKQLTVIKCKNQRGQKATPYSACYAPNGDIVAGCDDGTIKIWDAKAVARGSTQKAHNEAKEAHQAGQEITGLSVSSDGLNVLSRCRDETLKIWDMRKMNSALASFTGLENLFDQTNCGFSPNNNLFFTGTSVRKGKDGVLQGEGQLHVYDRQTLQPVRTLGFPDGSVVSCLWHPRINQLMVGTSSGATHAMYDPRQSEGGVMRSVGKTAKKADITQIGINTVGHVYAPHALPMFKEEKFATTMKTKRKERADPIKSKQPALGPVAAAQKGLSYPGAQSSRSLAQHFFKDQVGPSGMDYLNQDPREALLKYSEKVDADPTFTAAYKETQPEDGKDRFDYGEERREKRAKPYFY